MRPRATVRTTSSSRAVSGSKGWVGVAVLAVRNGRLVLADERSFESGGQFMAERALPTTSSEWVLVGYDRLVNPDGGQLVLPT